MSSSRNPTRPVMAVRDPSGVSNERMGDDAADMLVGLSDPGVVSKRDAIAVAGAAGPVASDYEAAVAELESLVERMEDGRFALEESLAAYQRGVDLVRFCRDQLAAVEQKVRVLEAGLLQPFEGDAAVDEPGGDS